MHTPLSRLVAPLIASLALAAGAALAAGGSGGGDYASDKSDTLSAVRTQLAAKDYNAAVVELKRINDTGSADWNNLMGFSLRKSSPPDFAGAERHYNEALRIEPTHRGALEYSGELYLMTGDIGKAEQRLKALDKACFLPCSEYTDLKKAVAAYKANGNRYVAAP